MVIEMERGGWLRVNDYAVRWTREPELQDEARLPGDPWFKWEKFAGRDRQAAGGCWLGTLRILWEYPLRETQAARAIRIAALHLKYEQEAARWEAERAAHEAAVSLWANEFGPSLLR